MRQLYPIFFIFCIFPFKCSCQHHEGLARILTTALESQIIQPYLPHDSSNQLNIHFLLAGRDVPTTMDIVVDGKRIPIVSDLDTVSGNVLHVTKLIWKNHCAKVILKGSGKFLARVKLKHHEENWEIANAYLRGIALRNGKKNKSIDIKF